MAPSMASKESLAHNLIFGSLRESPSIAAWTEQRTLLGFR